MILKKYFNKKVQDNKRWFVARRVNKDGTVSFLNYASRQKKLFSYGYKYYVVTSPYPSFRPIEDFVEIVRWVYSTSNSDEWLIVSINDSDMKNT